jgi:hypothetical protein
MGVRFLASECAFAEFFLWIREDVVDLLFALDFFDVRGRTGNEDRRLEPCCVFRSVRVCLVLVDVFLAVPLEVLRLVLFTEAR